MIGLLGGAYDPPHNGHVALAKAACERFPLERLVVVVVEAPGHKEVGTDAQTRLRLARAAFPDLEVVLDEHPYTVEMLREGPWDDPLFLIGADEFAAFRSWRDPDEVLERARLAVATRPGHGPAQLEPVLRSLARPERVELFGMPAFDVSSRDLRGRVARGESIEGLVPPAVARLVGELGLYRAA